MKNSVIKILGFCLSLSFVVSNGFAQNEEITADNLGTGQLELISPDAQGQIEAAMLDLKTVISNFTLALDSGTKITKAPTLGGTTDHPVYKVSVRKCVLFVCQNADLDIEFSLLDKEGDCDKNLILSGDLRRSSKNVTDSYSDFQVHACVNNIETGALISLEGAAVRAESFSASSVQGQVLSMLKLQFPAVMKALQITLGIPPKVSQKK